MKIILLIASIVGLICIVGLIIALVYGIQCFIKYWFWGDDLD